MVPGAVFVRTRDLVLEDAKGWAPATVLELSAEEQMRPLLQLIDKVFLVEPDGRNGTGVVGHLALDHFEAPATGWAHAAAAYADVDRRLLADRELADRPAPLIVAVIERQVLEQIRKSCDPELLGELRSPRTDTGESLDAGAEPAGTRQRAQLDLCENAPALAGAAPERARRIERFIGHPSQIIGSADGWIGNSVRRS
jgi:hypothetical protein